MLEEAIFFSNAIYIILMFALPPLSPPAPHVSPCLPKATFTTRLLSARLALGALHVELRLHRNPAGGHYYPPPFVSEETKAWRGQVTCQRHSANRWQNWGGDPGIPYVTVFMWSMLFKREGLGQVSPLAWGWGSVRPGRLRACPADGEGCRLTFPQVQGPRDADHSRP